MYWNWHMQRFFAADDGAGSGGETPPPEPTGGNEGEGAKASFTPEQQAEIEAMINKAYAKGAAKASKVVKSEAEKLAEDRAALEVEKARIKAQSILTKEGYVLGEEETDAALIGLFASAPDATEGNLAALKKLIEAKVNAEVDKRLKAAGQPKPKSGDKGNTVGDTINGLLRKI